VKEHNYILQF